MRYAPLSDRIEAFIEAASIKHDYRFVAGDFVNAHTKVSIICHDHGEFSKTRPTTRRVNAAPTAQGAATVARKQGASSLSPAPTKSAATATTTQQPPTSTSTRG